MNFLATWLFGFLAFSFDGEVAEWSNAAASKAVVPLVGTGGSNPSLTAKF
jgi:hypothetical protein